VYLSIANIDEQTGQKLFEYVGVAKPETPTLRIVVPGG